MKQKLTQRQKQIIRTCRKISVSLFLLVLGIFAVIGIALPARPKISEAEKRELTKFPSISWNTFWNGEFFSGVSLWYSDTYPMRDKLITADQNIKSLFGFEPKVQMVASTFQADEIPDPPVSPTTTEPVAAIEDVTAEPNTTEEKKEPVLPDAKYMEEEIQNHIQNGVYVENGRAYTQYIFSQSAAQIYIDGLESAARELEGQTNVYNILVPNQSGIQLSDETLDKLGGSNQKQGIEYYYACYDKVKGVPTYDELRAHKDEYLYFRSDHHWTQLGSYYAYQSFCKVKGIEPEDIKTFESKTFEPFLGSYYSSLHNSEMEANPDSVVAYFPKDTNEMKYWDNDGTEYDWKVVFDVEGWRNDSLYSCFVAGDRPLCIIENPKKTDGSSCLVLKESYGNCFVPWLVDHYQTVYVVDFRYSQVNVMNYIKEHNIKDLIVINNINIISSDDVAGTIASLLR